MRKLILLFIVSLFSLNGFSQNFTVHTLAGVASDSGGFKNGADSAALFNGPAGVAVDTQYNVFVADAYNNKIREIANHVTTTYAGDTAGFMDGTGTNALFNRPLGICTDTNGNVYVADTYNNAIRKISVGGIVTTIAGKGPDSIGLRNGPATNALFNLPTGVAIDKNGNIYVADYGNNIVRKISAAGMVTILAGNDTVGYMNGVDSTSQFYLPTGIAVDKQGNVYVSEIGNNDIREIRNDSVSTFAGFDTIGPDSVINTISPGYVNGAKDTVKFNTPVGMVVDGNGNVFVADESNNVIREVLNIGLVVTFVGNTTPGYIDSVALASEFYDPLGVAMDRQGNFYVADNGNNVIREIYPPGVVGINPVVRGNIKMATYPTPCNNTLNIVSSHSGKAELLDMTGRSLWSNDNFKSPYVLSTDGIAPGVYFFRLTVGTESALSKVVVAH